MLLSWVSIFFVFSIGSLVADVHNTQVLFEQCSKPVLISFARCVKMVSRSQKKRTPRASDSMTRGEVFLDTETTGLHNDDEILEIAIVGSDGSVLINTRVKPTCKKAWPEAEAIHGISPADVANAPTWDQVVEQVKATLAGKRVVIFNARFDESMLVRSCRACGIDYGWVAEIESCCAMREAADFYGATNKYGTISLINAALRAGVEFQGAAHSALADTLATRDVFLKIMEQRARGVNRWKH